MKTRKLLTSVLCVLMLVFSVFAFTACGDCEHEWGEWSVFSPSTCAAQGTKQRKCSKCDEVQTESIDIADHEYDTENLVWTWNGYESATATLSCITDSTHTRQINANVTDEVTTAPTCTATGTKTYTATVKIDGVTYTATKNETLAALGHTEVTDAAVPATCEKTGLTEGSHCSVCNEVLVAQQETPKAAHTETKIEAVAATCSAEGATEGVKCAVCNEILVTPQPVNKVAHTEETVPAVAATCENTGLTEGKKCSVCKEVLVAQQPTDKLPHTETTLLGVASSCSEKGLTEGKKCSVCGTVTVEQEPIDKLPHNEETIVGTAPTCSATGLSDGKKCSVCKETLVAQTILPKTACNYVSVVTAPTCEAQGYTTHTCSMCRDSFVDTYVDELGHNWGAWEVSGSYTLRNCINDCECGKNQRISSISATYNGIRLLTGESVWKDDVIVTATLSDNTTIDIKDFTLENDTMTVDGANYVTVKFHTQSTAISVPAIYNNLPGTTASVEFTYTEKNDAITITGVVGASTEIIIPAHINRVPVRYIGNSAFYENANITSVIIPDSIKSIGELSFYNCKKMVTVSLGKGLTSIGKGAFYKCISLSEITIPSNITSIANAQYYYNPFNCSIGVFKGCTSLKKVTIGDENSVLAETVIGSEAFADCTALENVYIGSNVKSIGDSAFSGCSLLGTLTIGENVESIGGYAFYSNENLSSVIIPNSVESIGQLAFYNCKRMVAVSFGTGLKTISTGAFYKCISINELVIPTNVTTIANSNYYYNPFNCSIGVFKGCTGLKKLTIGDNNSVLAETIIGSEAFADCIALEEVYIGNNVKSIGDSAFYGCTLLEKATLSENIEKIGASAFYSNENLGAIDIPDSVKSIGELAFYNCKRMKEVSFGSGLTTIGTGAFYKCISITELFIPANVVTIANSNYYYNPFNCSIGVFKGCTGLKKLTIGDNNSVLAETIIGSEAFADCTTLEEVYIGSNVKSIGDSAFSGCTLLETLTIGENVESIGGYAFYSNESLSNVIVPDSVKTIGTLAFYNCKRMISVEFGKGLTTIKTGAFYKCISLTELYIPSNVITIENSSYFYNPFNCSIGVFKGCTSLKKVTIGEDSDFDLAETVVGTEAFAGCISLEEVYIGNNVKTISDSAFEGCTSLTTIEYGTGVNSVGSYAFAGCTNLGSVTIPNNVMILGNNVFNNCTTLSDVTIERNGKELLRSFGSNVFNGCSALERLYFTGTPDDWASIAINSNNVYPLDVTPYFYSENQPSAYGDYWYYNGNNDKRVWNITDTAFEAEFSSENFVEIFGGEDSSYSTIFYNSLSNDTSFKTGLAAWQVLHMVADSSLVDGVWKISEKDLYELAIYDLLCNDANAQTEWLGLYNDSSYAYLSDYIKMFAGNEMTKEILQTYDANIDYCPEEIGIDLSIASMLFEVADNLYDAYLYCARYKAFSDMDQAFQIVLLQIANDSSNPSALREAARECANLYKTAADQMMLDFADKYATAGAKAIQNAFMGDIWSLVTENAFPTLGASVLAARGILLLSNMGFNVDDIYISYYELGAAVKLEGALRNVINDTLRDYYRKSNQESAEQYVYAIGLYKTSVLLGFDYSSALLDERSKAGDIDAEEKQEYVSMINNLASMKQGKEDLYNRFDTLVSQAYMTYYS